MEGATIIDPRDGALYDAIHLAIQDYANYVPYLLTAMDRLNNETGFEDMMNHIPAAKAYEIHLRSELIGAWVRGIKRHTGKMSVDLFQKLVSRIMVLTQQGIVCQKTLSIRSPFLYQTLEVHLTESLCDVPEQVWVSVARMQHDVDEYLIVFADEAYPLFERTVNTIRHFQ